MINPNNKLTVLFDNAGIFVDHTDIAADFMRDPFSIDMDPTLDTLYIGFYKPFGTIFAEINTGAVGVGQLQLEYFDGTVWQALTPSDETRALSRSGFIFFDKENMKETTVNGVTKFFVRAKTEAATGVMSLQAMNIVFSDDVDLQRESAEIINDCLYAAGFNSHITGHVASRNHIVQMLKNDGYLKYSDDCNPLNITEFDLMDIYELRQASTYLTLSKIYFRMADNQDSVEWVKYKEYQDKFEESFKLARLTLDKNDNGLTETSENVAKTKSYRFRR